jgi:hypothetical protein
VPERRKQSRAPGCAYRPDRVKKHHNPMLIMGKRSMVVLPFKTDAAIWLSVSHRAPSVPRGSFKGWRLSRSGATS